MKTFIRQLSPHTSSFSTQKGFTLIEMLVVLSLIGILTSMGIASYSAYNSNQTVQSSATDVETLLASAKSDAISQVVPSNCGSNSLTGYQVDFTLSGRQYTLSAVCGTKQVVSTNNLPPQLSFASGSTSSIFFAVSTGIITTTATVRITGYGKTKTVTVSPTGIMSVQ